MKIVIVEDERFFIERLKLILDENSSFDIVGAFVSAEEALAGYGDLGAELMIIDLMLPGMTGIELIREIKQRDPLIEIVAFTGSEDRDTVLQAIRAGASGYLLKEISPRDLYDSLISIISGGSPMSPRIVRALVDEIRLSQPGEKQLLSNREREVLSLARDNLSYKDIGQKLNISHNTVHTHLQNICEKFHVKTRQEAIAIARRKSLI